MSRLPVISGDEFSKAMRKVEYVWDHTEGSHMILLQVFPTNPLAEPQGHNPSECVTRERTFFAITRF